MFVDVDGSLKYCHGCGYHDSPELSFGSVYDSDIVDKIKYNSDRFVSYKYNEQCDKCYTKICYTCNVSKYIHSKKSDFMDRWYDFSCQPQQCSYFREITKYRMALLDAIGD